MRKALAVLAVASVLALALGGVLAVEAQGPGTYGYGRGMMGGRGVWGNGVAPAGTGVLHDVMVESMAEVLGMEVADFEAAQAEGQTFWQIALAQGVAPEDIPALMQQARDMALEKAVAEGLITQAQADWMAGRGAGPWGGHGFGRYGGMCPFAGEDGLPYGGRWSRPSTS
ncbi:MAG: hypothetical protein HPY83_05760 [Anaerolineae bacterium]|nr:hypothetical protein [Anaerolineae bacterium]